MSKVTSKLQVTLPKAIADQYGIRPGNEIEWLPAGDTIRVVPAGRRPDAERALSVRERLELFDQATERQQRRQRASRKTTGQAAKGHDRGWAREDLYRRGISD